MPTKREAKQMASDHLCSMLGGRLVHIAKGFPETSDGARKDAIKLKCLECSGGEIAEVKRCEVFACPLWAFRPYQ